MTTIFAPITSAFNAGISVVRISGSEVKKCLKSLGVKEEIEHQKISFQKIRDPQNNEIIDETLISFFANPHSFTGEDVAEISIHASPFILKKLLEILSSQPNCRLAEAGEFSKRAFLNGKIDLIQAEAIPDLIAAETEMQHRQALRQLEGELGKIYEDWRFRLIEISAMIEAAIDFPDEDLPKNVVDNVEESVTKLSSEIKNHLSDKKIGQKIKDGLNLAIIGAPNVGKSSLLNFLAKSDVAIVSEIAGTTRDVIDIHLSIAGIALKISDTAGIHETTDKIEAEGIRRALLKAKNADIKILMLDAANPVLKQDLIDENTIIVVNKIDLLSSNSHFDKLNVTNISLTENINTQELIKKLEEKILEMIPQQTSPLITQERYRNLLTNCLNNLEHFSMQKNIELAAEDLRLAAREIGKIIGRVEVDDILNIIFSRFCIGK
jgi:tRNA modification GTPase